MHDPTEGGLSAALYELAEAAAVGLRIKAETIRIFPEAAALCAELNINPLGAIASGALLICSDPAYETRICGRLRKAKIAVARIGTVVARAKGVTLVQEDHERRFPRFAVDELMRLLGSAPDRMM
jgi:hydrogenase maturation factor